MRVFWSEEGDFQWVIYRLFINFPQLIPFMKKNLAYKIMDSKNDNSNNNL
jgi:hypothetical protein